MQLTLPLYSFSRTRLIGSFSIINVFNMGTSFYAQPNGVASAAGTTTGIPGRLMYDFTYPPGSAGTLTGVNENAGITYPANGIEQAKRIDHIFVTLELAGLVRRAWIDEWLNATAK